MTRCAPNLHLGCSKDEDKGNSSIGMLHLSPEATKGS